MGKTPGPTLRCVLALSLLSAALLSAGCAHDPDDGDASLDLRIVRDASRSADAVAGTSDRVSATPIEAALSSSDALGPRAGKRQNERVVAAVLDASDLALGAIPVSSAYEDLVADYESQRLALTTWPQWHDLLARHYTILDEQELVIDGSTASGTLRAAFGWNLVAVAFLDSTAVTWVGLGPGRALPGGAGVAVVRVEPPVGYQLPATAPLQVVITSPQDDEVITSPAAVADVRGYLNDPFLETGTLMLDEDPAVPLPLLTGFFALPVPVTVGQHQVTVQVERARTEELATATMPFQYQLPLELAIDEPPNGGVTTWPEVDVRGTLSDDAATDSIVVYVNDVRAVGAWQEGSDFGSSLPVALSRGVNVVLVTAYRGTEVAQDQATLTRREPLYVRALELGGANGFYVDGNLGFIDTNLDAPTPMFTLEGALPANSRLRFRWQNLTTFSAGRLGVTDPSDPTGSRVIETPLRATGAYFQDDLALPVLPDGRHTFYYIHHLESQGFGAAQIDQLTLFVGNASDGEVFTLGAVDDSGADLNWGVLGNVGFLLAPARQTLSFRGEFTPYRWGTVRWNPGNTGPSAGEGIDLFVDGSYDWYTFSAGIPGPNATYVDDLLIPGLHFYGQHTLALAVRPASDSTAGVLIDLVRFDFDNSQLGSSADATPAAGRARRVARTPFAGR